MLLVTTDTCNLTDASRRAETTLPTPFNSPHETVAQVEAPQPTPRSLIRAELAQIAERYEAADRRAKRAATIADRNQAEDERREAEGDFWAAGEQLADLFLLMIRHCKQYRPDILQLYLAELLRPELEPYARAIAKLEARR